MLTIETHSVSSRCGSVDPSPLMGALVRRDANAHHSNSQHLELPRVELSTTRSASSRDRVRMLTIEIHSVLSCSGSRYPQPDRCRPASVYRLAAFPAFAGGGCPIRAARTSIVSTKRGMNPCGYLSPILSRRAVNFKGERAADRPVRPADVDIPHPRPIGTLCISSVSAPAVRRANPCHMGRQRPHPDT